MSEIGSALLVFALLLVVTALGVWVRPLLPEEHKAHWLWACWSRLPLWCSG
jgi:hypothetical protein